ncbi:hypothetical protein A2Z33_04785 [Candidatus Gottesmanbacteria bacterium RBG_16_52_11]|uniref:Uncharacterized protein n=1 Tax=Candidatus Gottesmanbacteria bacterium RBG_16_52_11 TaxID=1798374 RepID=A0A1F5YUK3_9BACT|nr:MAG: hypothetical protein A2Z33_04785 [Candidatus Gottesmanbacteria bacterium RBG_16_52_11]
MRIDLSDFQNYITISCHAYSGIKPSLRYGSLYFFKRYNNFIVIVIITFLISLLLKIFTILFTDIISFIKKNVLDVTQTIFSIH